LNQSTTLPHVDECRYLILKMIEQAVRDYLSLANSSAPIDRCHYESACQFLFSDDCYVDWGGVDRNLSSFLDILSIDIHWFRERIVKLKDRRIQLQKEKRSTDVEVRDEIVEEED
jgi:hypothetical protein